MLRFCYRRNPRATAALQDCLAVQHAKWIAHRIYRGLGPHRSSSNGRIPPPAPAPPSGKGRGKQRGHLHRFNSMFCDPTNVSASAAPSNSNVGSATAPRRPAASQPLLTSIARAPRKVRGLQQPRNAPQREGGRCANSHVFSLFVFCLFYFLRDLLSALSKKN